MTDLHFNDDEAQLATRQTKTGHGRFLPYLLLITVWAILFWPLLVGHHVVAFRDAGYWYYPLWQFVDQIEASGETPLWNPLDRGGRPLAADLSASVFYPGRWIFRLRWFDFPTRFGWYLAAHALLAATTAYIAARRMKAGVTGSLVGAIGYAFGGPVLFQVTNPIFLVGAAWLPLALVSLRDGVLRGKAVWLTLGGVALSMMLLGGDPQNVYHVLLLGGCTSLLNSAQVLFATNGPTSLARFPRAGGAMARWLVLSCLALGLSAVQILPTAEWSRKSGRSGGDWATSVWDGPGQRRSPSNGRFDIDSSRPRPDRSPRHLTSQRPARWEQWFVTPPPGTHAEQIYQFSQSPWLVAECLAPNISGLPYPQNRRWVQSLPGADRMWIPSMYLGLVVLAFAVARLAFRQPGIDRWLTWIAIWFLLGSFGWYGPVWFVREMLPSLSAAGAPLSQLAPPVGGAYWLMVLLLPMYGQFRYPAKLTVLASLAICLLAARGVSAWLHRPGTAWPRASKFLWSAVAINLAAVAILPSVLAHVDGRFADPVWGPLLVDEIPSLIRRSGVHAILISASLLALIQWARQRARRAPRDGSTRRREERAETWLALMLVALSSVDTIWANHRLIPTVNAREFTAAVRARYQLEDAPHLPFPIVRYRTAPELPHASLYERAWWTARFHKRSSPERLAEVIRVQRQWALPKHHLLIPAISYHSFSSIEPSSEWPELRALLHLDDSAATWRWGTVSAGRFEILVRCDRAVDVRWLPAIYGGWLAQIQTDPSARQTASQSTVAAVAADASRGRAAELRAGNENEAASGSRATPDASIPTSHTEVPMSLLPTESQRPLPSHGLIRLPRGNWRLVFEYRPASYRIGRAISIISWSGLWLAASALWLCRRRRRTG